MAADSAEASTLCYSVLWAFWDAGCAQPPQLTLLKLNKALQCDFIRVQSLVGSLVVIAPCYLQIGGMSSCCSLHQCTIRVTVRQILTSIAPHVFFR